MPAAVARVLVDSPLPQLDRLFDYAIPEELRASVVTGVRVRVPVRSVNRMIDGYVVDVVDSSEFEGELSPLESVESGVAVLAPEVWTLARRVADRGAGNASDVLRLAIPSRMVRAEKAWLAKRDQPVEQPDHRTIAVRGYPQGRLEKGVDDGERLAVAAVARLTSHERDGQTVWVNEWALTMGTAAIHCLASGKSAILVVPDYRDEEQLLSVLATLAPAESIARVDAHQPNQARYRAFLSCLDDAPRIIVGNRSAIYAPAHALGLIALWDDGDPLDAEPLAPYAHARDVALLRQEQQGAALMFFGHTRTVEVQRLVELGWVHEVVPQPAISPRVIPTGLESPINEQAAAARIPSSAWRAANQALQHGPVLVQVSRPGYAPVLACATCRQVAHCAVCGGPLGVAKRGATPSCGWCGALATNWHCDNCEGTTLRLVTAGSTRTAEELGRAFPGTRVIVSDGERPLLTIGAEPALIIATRGAEPIAAGGYQAVLLLDGERMLARESLKVGDDCLRWWSNAAALAAPRAPVVLVGVGGPLASAMATWRHDSYAHSQLLDRRELRFPPAVRVVTVTGTAATVRKALDALDEFPSATIIDLLGPVPIGDELVRAIIRFDYANGPAVASSLRASVVRNATARRRPSAKGRSKPAPVLRVRFDDPDIL